MKRIWTLARNDLLCEARAKQIAPVMVVFALSLVFLLTWALPPGAIRAPVPGPLAGAVGAREIAGILMWTVVFFAAVAGFNRSAAADREDTYEGLLLAPVDPAALFAGKLTGNFAFITAAEIAIFPIFMLFAGASPGLLFPGLLPVAFLGNLGLAAVGTLFTPASQHTPARSMILPLLTFPLSLPIILGSARLTSSLLIDGTYGTEARWFILMSVFDIVFITIGAATFEFVIQE
ncbi:MAG: heme exporter protein CcmB [Actinobacteria bacterium]|nr:heme exporter protein CcmB [Actinomycetota bacterium]